MIRLQADYLAISFMAVADLEVQLPSKLSNGLKDWKDEPRFWAWIFAERVEVEVVDSFEESAHGYFQRSRQEQQRSTTRDRECKAALVAKSKVFKAMVGILSASQTPHCRSEIVESSISSHGAQYIRFHSPHKLGHKRFLVTPEAGEQTGSLLRWRNAGPSHVIIPRQGFACSCSCSDHVKQTSSRKLYRDSILYLFPVQFSHPKLKPLLS